MGNRQIYKVIDGLQASIDLHLKKIEDELKKDSPNQGRIHHWQAEVNAWEKRITILLKRLGK